jgi:hypothetical protein
MIHHWRRAAGESAGAAKGPSCRQGRHDRRSLQPAVNTGNRARLRFTLRVASASGHPEFHHNVYVILLDSAVAKHRAVLRVNPNRDPAKPCVYVGMTGLPPEHRFENHKHGYKAAWVVEKYGVRLLPMLYEHLNPMPFEAAQQMEIELAEDLRAEGYTVTGGH